VSEREELAAFGAPLLAEKSKDCLMISTMDMEGDVSMLDSSQEESHSCEWAAFTERQLLEDNHLEHMEALATRLEEEEDYFVELDTSIDLNGSCCETTIDDDSMWEDSEDLEWFREQEEEELEIRQQDEEEEGETLQMLFGKHFEEYVATASQYNDEDCECDDEDGDKDAFQRYIQLVRDNA